MSIGSCQWATVVKERVPPDRVDSTLAQALELVLAAVLEHDAGA